MVRTAEIPEKRVSFLFLVAMAIYPSKSKFREKELIESYNSRGCNHHLEKTIPAGSKGQGQEQRPVGHTAERESQR